MVRVKVEVRIIFRSIWEGWVVVRVKVGVGSSLGLYGKGGWWLESRLRLGSSLSLWEGWVVVRVKVGVGSSLGLYGKGGWWLESRLGLDHL